MTVDELFARFPEIPADLHDEPLLVQFAETFDRLLQLAQKPSACAEQHDRGNQYYLKLVGPMDIYRYGLFTRERAGRNSNPFGGLSGRSGRFCNRSGF